MARKQRQAAADAFARRFIDAASWRVASLEERLTAPVAVRGFAAFAALTDRVAIDAEYIARAGTSWGHHARRVYPELSVTFAQAADRSGFTSKEVQRQWAALAKVAAIAGIDPGRLYRHRFNAACDQLVAAINATHNGRTPNTLTTPLHGLEAGLSALDILDEPRPKAGTTTNRQAHWDRLATAAPVLTTTTSRAAS